MALAHLASESISNPGIFIWQCLPGKHHVRYLRTTYIQYILAFPHYLGVLSPSLYFPIFASISYLIYTFSKKKNTGNLLEELRQGQYISQHEYSWINPLACTTNIIPHHFKYAIFWVCCHTAGQAAQ